MDVNPNSIEYLILEGAAEVAGIDLETGEVMYSFTDKLEQINPNMHRHVQNYVEAALISIWEKDFIEIDMSSETTMVSLKPKAYDKAEVDQLSMGEKNVLDNIIRSFQEENQV